MTALPPLLADPFLVCLPQHCNSVDKFEEFIDVLSVWGKYLQREDFDVFFPVTCIDAILNHGYYPRIDKLKNIASELGMELDELPLDNLAAIAKALFERTPSLEDKCGLSIVAFEEESCLVSPKLYVSRLPDPLHWAFKHALVVAACSETVGKTFSGLLIASSRSHPKENFNEEELQVTVPVDDLDRSGSFSNLNVTVPFELRHLFPVVLDGLSLLKSIGSFELWVKASAADDVKDAMNARIEELLAEGTGSRNKARSFRVGEHFLETARRNGFASRLNVIDSCARILLGLPKNAVEPLRISADSTDQRIREDGARASRTHLTKDGPGYRLMFWELADGSVEFANIGPKHELVIL